MAVIKQISVFDGSSWGTDDIGANAANIDFANSVGTTASIAGSSNLYTGLSNILPASKLTASRVLITGSDQKIATSNITPTQLGFLSGTSANIQNQITALNTNLNNKQAKGNYTTFSGNATGANSSADVNAKQFVRLSVTNSNKTTYMLSTDAYGIFLWDSTNGRTIWKIGLNALMTTRSVESSAYLKTPAGSTSVSTGAACYASVTAPTVSGYVFVTWYQMSTVNFVAPGYFENPHNATTNLWCVPTSNISNKKAWGYALYRKNVEVSL